MTEQNQSSNTRWTRIILFCISVVWVIALIVSGQNNYSTAQEGVPSTFADDVYDIPEAISGQEREYAASIGLGGAAPGWDRTSDYMIGTVVVGLVLPESNGNDRNWTSSEIEDV